MSVHVSCSKTLVTPFLIHSPNSSKPLKSMVSLPIPLLNLKSLIHYFIYLFWSKWFLPTLVHFYFQHLSSVWGFSLWTIDNISAHLAIISILGFLSVYLGLVFSQYVSENVHFYIYSAHDCFSVFHFTSFLNKLFC